MNLWYFGAWIRVVAGIAGRLSLCYATLHWHDSREVSPGFPCGRFLSISTLDGYRTNPTLTLCSRIRKLSSKNTGIFRYNPLSIKAVYILLACQIHRHSGVAHGRRKNSVATASRSRWRHSMRQTSIQFNSNAFIVSCTRSTLRNTYNKGITTNALRATYYIHNKHNDMQHTRIQKPVVVT